MDLFWLNLCSEDLWPPIEPGLFVNCCLLNWLSEVEASGRLNCASWLLADLQAAKMIIDNAFQHHD